MYWHWILLFLIWLPAFPAWGNGMPLVPAAVVQEEAGDEASDEAGSPEYQEVLKLAEQGKPTQAAKILDQYLTSHPHAHKFHLLRQVIANVYFRSRERLLAEQQILKFMRYQFENPNKSRPLLKYLPQLLINLSSIQRGVDPEASEVLDGTMTLLRTALEQEPGNSAYSNGLSSAVGLKARVLMQQSRSLDSLQLYQEEVMRLENDWRANLENPDAWVRLAYLMKSAEQTISMDDATVVYRWHFERLNLVAEGLKRFPTSTRLVKEYFGDSLKTIDEYEQLLPERALELYDRATTEIIETMDKQLVRKTLYPLRLDIGKKWQALKRKLARERLPGKPMPELGDVEWLLNRDGSAVIKQTEGVLMLVFWSSTGQDELGQLIALNDTLKNQYPNVRLCVVTHQLGESFGSLPFVTFKNGLTDENRQSFKEQMSKAIVEANGLEFPIGFSEQLLELSDRFGVETTPFGVIVRDGECLEPKWGPEMQGELIRQLGF